MSALSESYVATLSLLDNGDVQSAASQFESNFVAVSKKLYSEAASIYPLRFSKMKDWCDWTKRFYSLTRKTQTALGNRQTEEARSLLSDLRGHFLFLHTASTTQKSNDYIYAYLLETRADRPETMELAWLQTLVEFGKPAAKARASPTEFAKAESAWSDQIALVMRDGSLEDGELELLRVATARFYRDFGVQFE